MVHKTKMFAVNILRVVGGLVVVVKKLLSGAVKLTVRFAIATTLTLGIAAWSYVVYDRWFSDRAVYSNVRSMYSKLLVASGQSDDALPLVIVRSDQDNMYNDGRSVVVYTGFIERAQSYDEIALILGHEIAHGMLGHLGKLRTKNPDESRKHEALADKMGAVYMIKAGYNICKGRIVFRRWQLTDGNSVVGNHPDYSYRYDELNINCE